MLPKVFRDPLYNYIEVDRKRDGWLLEAIDSREVQRLRRVHQLGVSSFTYPGADHTRLCHTLGVLHLMGLAHEAIARQRNEEAVSRGRAVLLGAAVAHDVGHGPFSHLFEPCLGVDHEDWSLKILRDPDTELHKALARCDSTIPEAVAKLVDPDDFDPPAWQKSLLSSQLDVDRADYLRRAGGRGRPAGDVDVGGGVAGPPPGRGTCDDESFRVALPGAAGHRRPAHRRISPADPGHPHQFLHPLPPAVLK